MSYEAYDTPAEAIDVDIDVPESDLPADDAGGEPAPAAPAEQVEAHPAPAADPVIDERDDWFANVRQIEPPPTGLADYGTITSHLPDDIQVVDPEDHEESLKAAVRMGIGQTAMQALFAASIDAAREQVRTNYEGAISGLQESWGERTEERLALANEYINEVEQHWGGVKTWLRNTGLGNDPNFIKAVYRQAKARYG